jgi:hypothetical protein
MFILSIFADPLLFRLSGMNLNEQSPGSQPLSGARIRGIQREGKSYFFAVFKYSCTAVAALRPSAMAQTTRLWPRA